MEQKALLRKEALRLLSSSSSFPSGSEIADIVCARPEYRRARNLFAFCPLGTEPDIRTVIDRALEGGKAVWLPVCLGPRNMEFARVEGPDWREDLERHPNGTMVPRGKTYADLNRLEATLVLVPGLLFTPSFHRLGRGGGFYDGFLSRIQGDGIFSRLGVCLRAQLRAVLPIEPHDQRLDGLVILG